MTIVEKAALYVHEVVYGMTRAPRGNQETSLPARRIVALLFSTADGGPLLHGLILKYLALSKPTIFEAKAGSASAFTFESSPSGKGSNQSGTVEVTLNGTQVSGAVAHSKRSNETSYGVNLSIDASSEVAEIEIRESFTVLGGTAIDRQVRASVSGRARDEKTSSGRTGDSGANSLENVYRYAILPPIVSDYVFGALKQPL